ncbi:MAG: sulfur oxidation c-type cytochrome SoxX [Parvibaculaceae bacterium]
MMPLVLGLAATAVPAQELMPYTVADDAIPLPLTAEKGDAARGEGLVANRQASLCLLCHQGPFPEPHAQGTLAPDLRGVGARLSEGQIRLRVVDMPRLDPSTIMPAYHTIAAHDRVGETWRGKPILAAQAIEDIVAFLVTLQE